MLGADFVWLNSVETREQVGRACAEIPAPVMVIWGGEHPAPTLDEYAKLGVRIALYPVIASAVGLQAAWMVLNDFKERGTVALDDWASAVKTNRWGAASPGFDHPLRPDPRDRGALSAGRRPTRLRRYLGTPRCSTAERRVRRKVASARVMAVRSRRLRHRIAAQLGIACGLRGGQHIQSREVVFQVRGPQRRLGLPDRAGGRAQAVGGDGLAGEQAVELGFLRDQLLADRHRFRLHGREHRAHAGELLVGQPQLRRQLQDVQRPG